MSPRIPRLLSSLVLVSCVASCQAYGAEFRELEITGYSGAQVWKGVSDFATSRGFRSDPNVTDLGQRVYQTRWSGVAAAFRGSSRRRIRAEIVELQKQPPKWLVRYYVEEQTIPDSSKSMNPSEEDWEFLRQHRVLETQFLQVMRIAFPSRGAGKDGAGNPDTGATSNR